MKKAKLLGLLLVSISACLWGCGKNDSGFAGQNGQMPANTTETGDNYEFVQVLPSPDKYTYYVKNYVGQNLANTGYTSMAGDKRDKYGESTICLSLINADGTFIDVKDMDAMKEYVVVEQMPAVNTEIKLTYETDLSGNEIPGIVESTSIEEIVLLVDKVGTKPNKNTTLTEIPTNGDRHHSFIKDYTGRNLGNVGYVSWGGELRDYYGEGNIKLNLVTEDGSYIDLSDATARNDYIVVSQDVVAGSEMTFTYMKDSDGSEFDLIDTMTYDSVTLYVRKMN